MKIETVRHSIAHILASAVREFYPTAKFGMGPSIENGFYYDFELTKPLTPEDLPKIEVKMRELIKQNISFKKQTISKKKAQELFSARGGSAFGGKNQPYKLELIKKLPGKTVTLYASGKFIDLCAGPHVKSTKEINPDAFKLTRVAGAYWKGDEKNKMLTRIYGVAFSNKKDLQDYLNQQQEAEKRDHRVLGQKLEIFMLDEEVGQGLPIWLPNGAILRKIIEDFLYEQLTKQGYHWLCTPHIGNLNLWKKSGHWNFYKENLYSPIKIDEEEYLLKPMNCPFHVKVYNYKIRSYKELPIKFAELGTVYRYERSGVLHGLTRVRGFTQDDAHIICSPNQIVEEIEKLIKDGLQMLKAFGFEEYDIYLATRPKKYTGALKDWQKAENCLKYVLKKLKLKYKTDKGGGVFYGPKIDIKIKDSLQRPWQCTTIQFDFNLPERFDMTYIDEKGKKERPYMIHRALLGSLERFVGVLLEHYVGALPFWLSPVQCQIIPIADRHLTYAEKIKKALGSFRVGINDNNETVSKKIRDSEIQKIPYILVVGDKEIAGDSVGVRERGKGNIGTMKLDEFIKKYART